MARPLPANTDPESKEMLAAAMMALIDTSTPIAPGPRLTQHRTSGSAGPSGSSANPSNDDQPRSIHGQPIQRRNQKKWTWESEDEGATSDGPANKPAPKCGWCESLDKRCKGGSAATRCHRCSEYNLECSLFTAEKAQNRAESSRIAQARAYEELTRKNSPSTRDSTPSNRDGSEAKPARCVICRRNGESGKNCKGRGGRDDRCPLYERDRSAGPSQNGRPVSNSARNSVDSQQPIRPRRTRVDSSSDEQSDSDRRDRQSSAKKARPSFASVPAPPPPPPAAPSPVPAPVASSGGEMSFLLNELRASDKRGEQAKSEAEHYKTQATEAFSERAALQDRVGTLEQDIQDVRVKLDEKSKAFLGAVSKGFKAKERVGELEKEVEDLQTTLKQTRDERDQLEKLVGNDVSAASSDTTSSTVVQAKKENVDVQVGPAPSPDGPLPSLDGTSAEETIASLRAQLTDKAQKAEMAELKADRWRSTAQKASEAFQKLKTGFTLFEEKHAVLQDRYNTLDQDEKNLRAFYKERDRERERKRD